MWTFFIIWQVILFFIMILHDWVPIPPLNDVEAQRGSNRLLGSIVNGSFVLIPLILTLLHVGALSVVIFYVVLTLGTILSWWVPYFFGSSKKHKATFRKFDHTHHFLPKIGSHVVPNTLHVILHLFIWSSLGFSIYFL